VGRPSHERRKRRRVRVREIETEIRHRKAEGGWIRRHSRVPFTGSFFQVDGRLWLMYGWCLDPPGIGLTARGESRLLPIERLSQLRYDSVANVWTEAAPAAKAAG
jgi:hypothetical protein